MPRRRQNLLREAIADARAVRETALANAKMALEEAFTPQLTSMLADRIREADDEMYDDELDIEELNDPVHGDGHGSEDDGETDVDAVEKSSFTEAAVDVDTGAQNDSDLDSSDIAPPEDHSYDSVASPEPDADARQSSDIDNEGKLGMNEMGIFDQEDDDLDLGDDDFSDVELGEEGDELDLDLGAEDEFEEEPDLDLEAIIRELEADIDDEEEEFGDEFGDEDELDLGENYPQQPPAADGHGSDEQGEGPDTAAVEKSSFSGEQDVTDSISEMEMGDHEDDEEIDLEEILREIEDEEEVSDLEMENASLRSELKEYRKALTFLRSKLNEVNLLNAKLLYTNKLFKNYSMGGREKLRVVESFDRATTVREAKLVYASLAEAYRGKPVKRKRRITEGLASRVTGNTRSRRARQSASETTIPSGRPTVITEGAELVSRFQKLAGIRRDN